MLNVFLLRIDYVLSSKDLAEKAQHCESVRKDEAAVLSDHFPVKCVFNIDLKE